MSYVDDAPARAPLHSIVVPSRLSRAPVHSIDCERARALDRPGGDNDDSLPALNTCYSTTHLRERPCTRSLCRLDCRERPCTQSTARAPVHSIAQVVAMTIHYQPLIPAIRRRTCESARALDRRAVSIYRQVVVTQQVQSTTLKTCGLKECRLST